MLCLLLAGSGVAVAGASPPNTDEAASAVFADAPAEIREFLAKAQAADVIVDPLARCVAFPDLPGNRWPKGLAKAHCEFNFGPHLTRAKAEDLVGRGAFAELDAMFAADLERHFSATDFSEIIHADFDAFDGSYETGRLTKSWLDNAPRSAYALAARAVFYRNMAWQARGGKFIKDTPKGNIERMNEFAGLAIDLYRRAIEVEPRLLPAYVGLMDIGNIASASELEAWARQAATRIDPACKSVTGTQMAGLEPRWGGSYPEMLRLSREIAPFVSQRPLLALNTIWPAVDLADVLSRNNQDAKAIDVLEPVVLETTHPQAYEILATSMLATDGDPWQTLVYLLEAARFRQGRPYVTRSLGRALLLQARHPEWGLRYLKEAAKADPDDAYTHYLMGAAYSRLRDVAGAEAEYGISMRDRDIEDLRRDSVHELVDTLIRADQYGKALKHVELLNREYPGFANGWKDRAVILGELAMEGSVEAMEKYVRLVDRSDPVVRAEVEDIERQLRKHRAQTRGK
ncbi:MAG TPA: hypothetical protein VM619_13660 [Luteimonas sp.]|nr:hypothetical protein [Luteimonas sp.]